MGEFFFESVWYSFTFFADYELPVASIHGKITDDLFWLTMWVTVVAFTIIFIAMFWFTFAYRYNKGKGSAIRYANDGPYLFRR